MSLNQILFRSSSGVVRREDINDELERRVFDIVASTQEDGIERAVSFNPIYDSQNSLTYKCLKPIKHYIGVFNQRISDNYDLSLLEDEIRISKLYVKAKQLFIIPSILGIRNHFPDRIGNYVYAGVFSEEGDVIIEVEKGFTHDHEQQVRDFLQNSN